MSTGDLFRFRGAMDRHLFVHVFRFFFFFVRNQNTHTILTGTACVTVSNNSVIDVLTHEFSNYSYLEVKRNENIKRRYLRAIISLAIISTKIRRKTKRGGCYVISEKKQKQDVSAYDVPSCNVTTL